MPLTREEAAALRAKYRLEVDKLRAQEKAAADEDVREMLMLERRMGSEIVTADLGGGDTIRLWACLSEEEILYLGQLQEELYNKESPPTEERRREIIYEMIEHLTVNPNITAEWLREHPDKFSMHDALVIYLAGVKMVAERAAEVARIQNFRTLKTGPSVR